MQIVGVTGLPGAGRKTFAKALASHRGWQFISLAELIRQEARRRHQPETPDTLVAISQQWRTEEGEDALIRRAIAAYDQIQGSHRGLIIAPLLRPAEAEAIHALAGRVVWLDAPEAVRLQRLNNCGNRMNTEPEDAPALHQRADSVCDNAGNDLRRFQRNAVHVLGDDQCCAVEFD